VRRRWGLSPEVRSWIGRSGELLQGLGVLLDLLQRKKIGRSELSPVLQKGGRQGTTAVAY
jgi:hypothetical protein